MSLEEAAVSADNLGSLDAARRPCASGARLSDPRDGVRGGHVRVQHDPRERIGRFKLLPLRRVEGAHSTTSTARCPSWRSNCGVAPLRDQHAR